MPTRTSPSGPVARSSSVSLPFQATHTAGQALTRNMFLCGFSNTREMVAPAAGYLSSLLYNAIGTAAWSDGGPIALVVLKNGATLVSLPTISPSGGGAGIGPSFGVLYTPNQYPLVAGDILTFTSTMQSAAAVNVLTTLTASMTFP